MRRLRVRLVGGLGNQLFGYAAGYVMAEKSQRRLELDTSWTRHGVTDHGVDIRHFDLPGVWLKDRRLRNFLLPPGSWAGRLGAAMSLRLAEAGRMPNYVIEVPESEKTLKGASPLVYLRGYFQEQDVVKMFLGNMPGGLKLKRESPWLRDMSSMAQVEHPLGLHVRLGDYATLPGGQALDFGYYERALSAASAQMGSAPVWIFTDDPIHLRSLTQMPTHWRVVDTPDSSNAAESLILFSRLNGYIVANSTFSWWGATLGNKPLRTWRPEPWFSYGTPSHLVPSDWIPIPATHTQAEGGLQ